MRLPLTDLWASVTGRLYLVIGILTLVLVGTNLQGLFFSLDVTASTNRLVLTSLEAVRVVDRFAEVLDRHNRVLAAALQNHSDSALRAGKAELGEIDHALEGLNGTLLRVDAGMSRQVAHRIDEISAVARLALDPATPHDSPAAAANVGRYWQLVEMVQHDVAAWRVRMRTLTSEELRQASDKSTHEEKVRAITAFAAGVVGIGALMVARTLLSRMRRMTGAMLSLAGGDMTTEIPFRNARDELGKLATALEIFRAETLKRRQNKANQRAALEQMSAAIVVTSPDGCVVTYNQKAAALLGLSRRGTHASEVYRHLECVGNWPADQVQALEERIRVTRETGHADRFDVDLPDGRCFAVNTSMLPNGNFLLCSEDITERRISAARIHHLAHYDPLTDLPNRTLFQAHLSHAVEHALEDEGLTVTMLMCDLDRFKEVNDTHGHPAGDELLRQVAARLSATMRKIDTLARLAGDEFAVIHLTGADARDAHALAERILTALSAPFELCGATVSVGVSIGIAQAPQHAGSVQELMTCAGLALYAAKCEGRHRFALYSPEMAEQLEERRAIETDLRKALDEEALEVYYQPQVDLATRAIVGVEALARWRHPTRGDVPPSVFVPIAEETGLIVQLGAWVLRRACQDAAIWDTDLMIAVNVSPRQLEEPDFLALVDDALQRSELPAARLELEVTESAMLADGAKMLAVFDQVRSKGIRLALDDFGTGYSALSYLQKFPFDRIKIDRSFVRDLGLHADSEAIIRAVAGLGSSLGISTIAEGIETEWQAALVREAACQDGQGYLFSRPVPVSGITALLAAQRAASEQREDIVAA